MKVSLYIHFPFCIQKCLYCDFNSRAASDIPQKTYVNAVIREMEIRRATLTADVAASTLYFGGGTPSLMDGAFVKGLIDAAFCLYSLDKEAEITLEANPGTVNEGKLAAFRAAGVNRLSLGIQSFSGEQLLRLGRVHSAREGIDAFNAARSAGFDNIGIDLIHSLPGQTCATWLEELLQAISLRPEHISAYGLTVEPGTPFHSMEISGGLSLPTDETAAEIFEKTSDVLCNAGYDHYEISNYSLPGFRSQHNQVYWKRGDYLGFGAGAHSFLASPSYGKRWRSTDSPARYLSVLSGQVLPEEELTFLSKREAMSEFIFLRLRMVEGFDTADFLNEFGDTVEEAFPAEIPKLLEQGLLERRGGAIRLSGKGLTLSNQVFIRFV